MTGIIVRENKRREEKRRASRMKASKMKAKAGPSRLNRILQGVKFQFHPNVKIKLFAFA